METGASTRESDPDPTHERAYHDQNDKTVIQGCTCHPDEKSRPAPYPRKQLIKRLRKRECELCETGTTVAVHQVTRLKELGKPGPGQPAWAALMAKMRRKTLIVCAACHEYIHATPVAIAA